MENQRYSINVNGCYVIVEVFQAKRSVEDIIEKGELFLTYSYDNHEYLHYMSQNKKIEFKYLEMKSKIFEDYFKPIYKHENNIEVVKKKLDSLLTNYFNDIYSKFEEIIGYKRKIRELENSISENQYKYRDVCYSSYLENWDDNHKQDLRKLWGF